MTNSVDLDRKFEGTINLYGIEGHKKIANSHIVIIGIGGVGSWAAESLIRSGVKKITLIDLDDICISNTNRQVHVTTENVGQMKATVMKDRLLKINPDSEVIAIEDFITRSNMEELLPDNLKIDYIIDCIDSSLTKSYLVKYCIEKNLKLVTIGASGGKTDPTQICITDLNRTIQDNLLGNVRRTLKKKLGFKRITPNKKFNITAVYSPEQTNHESDIIKCDIQSGRKNCQSGMGSASFITGSFAFIACAFILKEIAKGD